MCGVDQVSTELNFKVWRAVQAIRITAQVVKTLGVGMSNVPGVGKIYAKEKQNEQTK